MQKTFLWSLLLLLGIFVGTGFAMPIADTYLHPNDTEGYQTDVDVIGNQDDFDILGHMWFSNKLEIYLKWDEGEKGVVLNAMLGDVFFYDNAGASLEYFVPVRDHTAAYDGNVLEKGKVYSVETTRLSDEYYSPPITSYTWPTRNFGDTEVVTGVSTGMGNSYFTVNTSTGGSPNIISLDFLGDDDLSLLDRDIRFAFTCGNDVHDSAPVPEPATMILFGTGLIGLAGLGRSKFKKQY